MKFILFVFGILLPYQALAQIKTTALNFTNYHPAASGWNSSVNSYNHQSGNGYFTTLPPFNYNSNPVLSGHGWNSSTNWQQQSTPYPALNYNGQLQNASGHGWNSSTYTFHQSGSAPHPTLPAFNSHTNSLGHGWNSQSSSSPQAGLNNYNIQTVTNKPMFIDRTAEFLNKTRLNIAPGVCFTEVPTASLVGHLNTAVPRGNGSNPALSRVQICCEGYKRNPHILSKCDPICRDDCPNGICTAPNTCICLPGNIRDYEDNCVPTCPIGCRNGNCQPDGSCVCKPGFILDPVTRQFCKPHCSRGCGGVGTCVAPETCRCPAKYELSPAGVCQPKCDNCDGICTAPGVCTCDRGYIRKGNVCEPICSKGCLRGTCTAPETCSCKPGFTLDSSRANCVPHCDKPCLNGFCDGYNVCSCNPGYILDATQSNMCKAHCPSGCPNGHCTSPNFCICKPGFRKSGIKGQQNCIPFKN